MLGVYERPNNGDDSEDDEEGLIIKPLDAAAEMNMLPAVMWEMKPTDFWRMYTAYKKRERASVKMMAVQKFEGNEHDFMKFYEEMYYFITETPKIIKKPKKAAFLSKSKEEREAIIKKEQELLKKVRENGKR